MNDNRPVKHVYEISPNHRTVRVQYPDGNKKLSSLVNADGQWQRGSPEPPYDLFTQGEIGPGAEVLVHEGEPKVVLAAELGFASATSPFGANSAKKADWSSLKDCVVVVLPDNDKAGQKYAQDVVDQLFKLNPEAQACILDLPGLKRGEDIVDFVKLHRTRDWSDDRIKQEIRRLIDKAKTKMLVNPKKRSRDGRGGRNVELFDHAVELRRQGVAGEELLEQVRAENAKRYDPPLPDREVRSITRRVSDYEINDPSTVTLEYLAFPLDALPEAILGYIQSGARALDCDPALIAMPLLAALGGVIGNTTALRIKSNWVESPVLWVVVVAPPGTMKTPAMKLATVFLDRLDALERLKHEKRYAEYERELKRYKTAKNKDELDEPKPPTLTRIVIGDITIEAVVDVHQNNPRGMVVVRDEISGLFASFDRYAATGGGDVAQWLEIHSSGAIRVDRKTGDRKSYHVSRSSVSMIGTIQPGALRAAMPRKHVDNGFLARETPVMPPPRIKVWTDDELDPKARAAVEQLFDRLYAIKLDFDEFGRPAPVLIRFSPKAMERWKRFVNEHNAEAATMSESLQAAYSKLESAAARIALILHMVKVGTQDSSIIKMQDVDDQTLASALTILAWCKNEVKRVYAMLGQKPSEPFESTESNGLIDVVRRRGDSITANQLRRCSRKFKTNADAERALDELVASRHGIWCERPSTSKGGRPTFEFTLGDFGDRRPTIREAWRTALPRYQADLNDN